MRGLAESAVYELANRFLAGMALVARIVTRAHPQGTRIPVRIAVDQVRYVSTIADVSALLDQVAVVRTSGRVRFSKQPPATVAPIRQAVGQSGHPSENPRNLNASCVH